MAHVLVGRMRQGWDDIFSGEQEQCRCVTRNNTDVFQCNHIQDGHRDSVMLSINSRNPVPGKKSMEARPG